MERLSISFVTVFYVIVALVGFFCGHWLADIDVMVWHNQNQTSIVLDAGLGAGVGIAVVIASQVLDRTTKWARLLSSEFTKMLGSLSVTQAFVFAISSGVAEEVFFRGFLQQLLSVRVFGGETDGGGAQQAHDCSGEQGLFEVTENHGTPQRGLLKAALQCAPCRGRQS